MYNGRTVEVEKIVYRNFKGNLVCYPVSDIKYFEEVKTKGE